MPNLEREVEELFAAHHDAIYRYLVRLTGDGDLAADLAQETFVRWVEREPDRDNPRAWLYTVATNLARDHGRVGARRLTLIQGADRTTAMGEPEPAPDTKVEAAQTRRGVRTALDALSEKERTLLLMQQEGFTHREIAQAIDVNPKSVGVLLGRALRRFRDLARPELERLR
jgi:RNA polymerase sigma factor (sigma-70 family)